MVARPRKTYLNLIIFTLFLFTGGISFGQCVQADDGVTAIEVDSTNNVIRFYVEGEEVAILDSEGIHVYGDVSYNGVLMDGTPLHIEQGGENDSGE